MSDFTRRLDLFGKDGGSSKIAYLHIPSQAPVFSLTKEMNLKVFPSRASRSLKVGKNTIP